MAVLAAFCLLAGPGIRGQDVALESRTRLLFNAISNLEERTAMGLIAEGVDVNARNGVDWTLLHDVSFFPQLRKVLDALLARGANIEARAMGGKTPLLWAVEHANEYMTSRLLAVGVDVKATDDLGRTALHLVSPDEDDLASHIGSREEILRLLIRSGLDIEARDVDGRRPLHAASENRFGRMAMRILLAAGADAGARAKWGATALHFASGKGAVKNVRLLLSRRFRSRLDVDATDDLGRTALFLASEKGHMKVVRRLLRAGADTGRRDEVGRTALDMAVKNGHENVARVLRRNARGFLPRCVAGVRGLLGV